ncbi:MAG: flagellar hook protein FlgE [Ignavibacteria bacterium]
MSLLNSLYSGVSGLRNHQTMLDVIGNNIANVNTIGYKGSRVTFSDTFNEFVRSGSNPTDSNGGTNTYQVGLGSKINSIDRDWNQGTFESTGYNTDLALEGDALFVLNNNGEQIYSRAGTFAFDSNYNLVNTENGAIVQGKVATSSGVIPPGNNLEDIRLGQDLRKLPAVATTEAVWGGNLDSTSSKTRSEAYVQSGNVNSGTTAGDTIEESNTVYGEDGTAYTLEVTYEKATAADTWNVTWDLKDSEGTSVATSAAAHVLVFDASGDLDTIDGATPESDSIDVVHVGSRVDFNLDVTGVTQTSGTTTLSSSVDGNREPTIVNGTLTIFDSLGNAHTLTLQFTKTDDNNWLWSADVPDESGTLADNSGTIVFNSNGSISAISPNPPVLSFTPSGGAAQQNIELNLGSDNEFDGITQTSADSAISALSQNGSSSATLSDVNIDQNGYIVGSFSNGYSRNLGQIMLATFSNLNGLTSVGENSYIIGANSGDPLVGAAGEPTNTTIQSGALEQSNVDLSEEFTRMIVSQRGYQANARIITVSDEILQEATNLIR